MNLITAVDRHWGIGKNGRLLVSIPEDQRLFRQETLGKTVIMGRKTLESLPGGQPLFGRTTLVLSRDPKYGVKGAKCFTSVEAVLEAVKEVPGEDVFVAGGGEIYRAFLPFCHTAHVTYIDYAYEADTYFPNLDKDPEWVMDLETEEATYFDLCYSFRRYVRKR
ncbi:MAG: dihydrofolate reductase [Hungatella sp.]|nr:dihydrofolate reductase [Hungatella sp.]